MIDVSRIRNFCIIAHIDHGKSTFADRLLEITKTVEARKMRSQYLDQMDIERERGITIKMQPVRMNYKLQTIDYVLNLIDTPGHIDFHYEVSRALCAVEGAILLVDATQGVQAQTIANLDLAKKHNLVVIPVINKIDLPEARVDDVRDEIVELLECQPDDILLVSAKTGAGAPAVLDAIVKKIPCPQNAGGEDVRALIFDSHYSPHKGTLAYVRVFGGEMRQRKLLHFFHKNTDFDPMEVGVFSPQLTKTDALFPGEIGYVATNIKDPMLVRVGDTIGHTPIEGYEEMKPVVWAGMFPINPDEFDKLKDSFIRLQLNDAALSFEVEGSDVSKRALRAGFLGMLHLEITTERLRREFDIEVVVSSPSVEYRVFLKNESSELIRSPRQFRDVEQNIIRAEEQWYLVSLISRVSDMGALMDLVQKSEGIIQDTRTLAGNRVMLQTVLPLRKLVGDFFDDLKSATQGYGSLSYEFSEWRQIQLVELRVMIADKEVPQFSKLVPRHEAEYEARKIVQKLHGLLPRQLFATKIQGMFDGRIVASATLSATGKNVTEKLYGGDRSRKMKLWKKQKEGKKRLLEHAEVDIPQEVYLKMIRKSS